MHTNVLQASRERSPQQAQRCIARLHEKTSSHRSPPHCNNIEVPASSPRSQSMFVLLTRIVVSIVKREEVAMMLTSLYEHSGGAASWRYQCKGNGMSGKSCCRSFVLPRAPVLRTQHTCSGGMPRE